MDDKACGDAIDGHVSLTQAMADAAAEAEVSFKGPQTAFKAVTTPEAEEDDAGRESANEGQEDEVYENPALEKLLKAFLDAKAGSLDESSLKHHYVQFLQARVARGDDRAAARAEAKDVVQAFKEAIAYVK